jgi:hypothetical protein
MKTPLLSPGWSNDRRDSGAPLTSRRVTLKRPWYRRVANYNILKKSVGFIICFALVMMFVLYYYVSNSSYR